MWLSKCGHTVMGEHVCIHSKCGRMARLGERHRFLRILRISGSSTMSVSNYIHTCTCTCVLGDKVHVHVS